MEPMNPLSSATHTMLGLPKICRQKSGAPGAGPQFTTLRRPASPATRTTAPRPPSTCDTMKARVRLPATRNIRAWKTLVHTMARTPPAAM